MNLLNNRLFSINTDKKTLFNYYSINGLKLTYDDINILRTFNTQIKNKFKKII
jgi:hypothetical protein